MDVRQLRRLKPELDQFLDRYLELFGREETQGHARQFVHGLLRGGERRNVENIAETVKDGVVRSLQKFIGQAKWQDDVVLEELQRHVTEVLGDREAILNIDETGFPKKGTKSVGVQRQYAGCLGRTDNCQVGVFVNYRSNAGHTLIDRRLFLPKDWAKDGNRRREAGVPDNVVFRTKPELAEEMVRSAVERGLPFQWVTGDTVYGESPTLVRGVRSLDKWYVMDVGMSAHVWLSEPTVIPAGTRGQTGQLHVKTKATTKPIPVREALTQIPANAWQRITVADGSQGPRIFEYAQMPAWFSEEGQPSGQERLLIRRSLDQQAEVKCHRSNAPMKVPLTKVAEVRGGHWSVEQGFEAAKGECGLDEYETRGWVGWHHHTGLALLALWFLALQRQRLGEKEPQISVPEVCAILNHLLDVRHWDEREILRWSTWRQKRNRIAKACHTRRRRRELARRKRHPSGAL